MTNERWVDVVTWASLPSPGPGPGPGHQHNIITTPGHTEQSNRFPLLSVLRKKTNLDKQI